MPPVILFLSMIQIAELLGTIKSDPEINYFSTVRKSQDNFHLRPRAEGPTIAEEVDNPDEGEEQLYSLVGILKFIDIRPYGSYDPESLSYP